MPRNPGFRVAPPPALCFHPLRGFLENNSNPMAVQACNSRLRYSTASQLSLERFSSAQILFSDCGTEVDDTMLIAKLNIKSCQHPLGNFSRGLLQSVLGIDRTVFRGQRNSSSSGLIDLVMTPARLFEFRSARFEDSVGNVQLVYVVLFLLPARVRQFASDL